MALNDRKITVYANPVANLPDHPSQLGFTATQLKAAFDAIANEEVKTTINGIIDDILAIVDGASGADQIGATAITDLNGSTVQSILESLRNKLKSIVDGSSGADFIGATAISNLDGTTVQAILESLRNKLKSIVDGSSGADFIGATAIKAGGAVTVRGQLLELLNDITTVNNNEATRINNEAGRVTAENLRAGAEILRANAAVSQSNAEGLRVTAEDGRVIAEQTRVEADILRGQTVEAIETNYAPRLTSAEQQINDLAPQQFENDKTTSKYSGSRKPIWTIIDDDGRSTAYTIWKPTVSELKIPISIPLVTGLVGNSVDYMTWEQVNELKDLGVEFGSHTSQHLNLVTGYNYESVFIGNDESTIETELIKSKQELVQHGIFNDFLVYPQNAQNETTRNIVRRYFKCAIGLEVGTLINVTPIKTFRLTRQEIGLETQTLDDYKAMIDSAVANTGWLITMSHSQTLLNMSIIKEAIAYAQSIGVEIVTVQKGLQIHGNQLEYGVDTSANYSGINADGMPFGNVLDKYRWYGTVDTGFTGNNAVSFFPKNSTTVYLITGANASTYGYPEASNGGLLETRHANSDWYSYQLWHVYNKDKTYIRTYDATNLVWGAWKRYNKIFDNAGADVITSTMLNTNMPTSQRGAYIVSQVTNTLAATFPEGAGGILITNSLYGGWYQYQIFHPNYNEKAFYKRVMINNNAWSDWQKFSMPTILKQTVDCGSIPANSVVDTLVSYSGLTTSTPITVQVTAGLPNGLMLNAHTSGTGIWIRIANLTGSAVTVNQEFVFLINK